MVPLFALAGCGNDSVIPPVMHDMATSDGPLSGPAIVVDDDDFDFDPVMGAPQSADAVLTITNRGDDTTGPLSLAIDGDDFDKFVVTVDECSRRTLAPAASCPVHVALSSPVAGAFVADLRVRGEPGGLAKVHLHGHVRDGALVVSPASYDYGTLVQYTGTGPVSFTVTNTGGATSGAVVVGKPSDPQFSLVDDGCAGHTLRGGESCTFTVRYAPGDNALGSQSAVVPVTASPGGSATTALSGKAAAAATMAVGDFDFGAIGSRYGDRPVHTFVVTNTGSVAGQITSVALGNGAYSDFAVTSDGCTGKQVAAGATCSVDVKVTSPIGGSGARSDALAVTVASGHAGRAAVTATLTIDYVYMSIESFTAPGSITTSDGKSCNGYLNYCQFFWPLHPPAVTFTATPSGTSKFTQWSGSGCTGSTTPTCTLTPSDGGYLYAYFSSN